MHSVHSTVSSIKASKLDTALHQVDFRLPMEHGARAEEGGRKGQEPPRLPEEVQEWYRQQHEQVMREQAELRQGSPGAASPGASPCYQPPTPPSRSLLVLPLLLHKGNRQYCTMQQSATRKQDSVLFCHPQVCCMSLRLHFIDAASTTIEHPCHPSSSLPPLHLPGLACQYESATEVLVAGWLEGQILAGSVRPTTGHVLDFGSTAPQFRSICGPHCSPLSTLLPILAVSLPPPPLPPPLPL